MATDIGSTAAIRSRGIFDRPLDFGEPGGLAFCVFQQMQLSHDGGTLYLVSPVYATSGSLAIVNLARGSVTYVPGVMVAYLIATGANRGELIYMRRVDRMSPAAYPIIHAGADGKQIREISNEEFGGDDRLPLLRAYLRKIGGTITLNGVKVP